MFKLASTFVINYEKGSPINISDSGSLNCLCYRQEIKKQKPNNGYLTPVSPPGERRHLK